MKPSQVVDTLRRIATAIENSKRPDPTLVAADLKKVIANLTEPTNPEKPNTKIKNNI
jgi:hypothetical protein